MTTNGGPVNGLPPHLTVEDVPEAVGEELYEHRWLYSVIPIGVRTEQRDGSIDYPLQGFLTGYCKVCDTVFSRIIPTGRYGNYTDEKANVPRYGCVSPLAGL